MKYDPESPAMTDSCVERHRATAQCFLFPRLELQPWTLSRHESFYRSFRRLGNDQRRCRNVYLSMQRSQRLSLIVDATFSAILECFLIFVPLHSSAGSQLAIFISAQYILQNVLSRFTDSVTHTLSCASHCYWNTVTENTHFYCSIKLQFDPDLPSICLVMKVYEVDACLHICSPS